MKVGNFIHGTKQTLQVMRSTQVHQLYFHGTMNAVQDVLDGAIIRVSNNTGQITPPMSLKQLAVLNGDEYPLQVGVCSSADEVHCVLTYEICDEGSISRPVYVELDLTALREQTDVELDSIDVSGTTAVRMRLYNFSNVVSPEVLPKNSVCIIPFSKIRSLQKNNDLMGVGEILTHSNCIIREGTLSEMHPYVPVLGNPVINGVYASIAYSYVMGAGSVSNGFVIIKTGEDDFLLSPTDGGCPIVYCQKQLTKIAQQVNQALVEAGQANNVDKGEFAAAVAAVGQAAEKEGKTTAETQYLANKVVGILPSSQISKVLGIKNFNLASETVNKSGLVKTL